MYKKNQIPIPRLYRHTRGYLSAVEIGRDVELLRVLWEAGAGEYWLWRRYGVGGRVLGELSSGWDLGKREAVMRKDGDGPVSVGGYGGGLALWVDLLAGVEEPNWGRGFPFGEMARALEAIEGGCRFRWRVSRLGLSFRGWLSGVGVSLVWMGLFVVLGLWLRLLWLRRFVGARIGVLRPGCLSGVLLGRSSGKSRGVGRSL